MQRVNFALAGFTATIYDAEGDAIIARDVPMLRESETDKRVVRDDGGVPFIVGDFTGIIPLTQGIPNAAQVLVRSLRRSVDTPYDLVEADDDEGQWTTRLVLARRLQPIGAQ